MGVSANLQLGTVTSLKAPFSRADGLLDSFTSDSTPSSTSQSQKQNLVLPAAYNTEKTHLEEIYLEDPTCLKNYFRKELDVSRLNEIHSRLRFAGLERTARMLHNQRLIGWEIVITEQADMHLVWHESRVFLKPLPEFLLCHQIWEVYLVKDSELYGSAAGFLLSYMWLVCTKSDFNIALEERLLPPNISWEQWVSFSRVVLANVDHHTFKHINPRYRYGELRLRRLNWIYRFFSRRRSWKTVIRGYSYLYHQYSNFFERNTSWLASVTIYIVLVLTAMQVGLGTDRLKNNTAFQSASYGFTIFSILAPLAILGGILLLMLILVIFNWKHMIFWDKGQRKARKQTM